MKCNNCGNILPQDSVFCQFCGNKIEEVTAQEEPAIEQKSDAAPTIDLNTSSKHTLFAQILSLHTPKKMSPL